MFHDVLDNPNNHNITHAQKTQGDLSLNKIEIRPIDALLEVLGFTTFSI